MLGDYRNNTVHQNNAEKQSALLEQITDLRQEVEDNQILIITIADPTILHTLHEITTKDIKETIDAAIVDAFAGVDSATVNEIRKNALAQVAAM